MALATRFFFVFLALNVASVFMCIPAHAAPDPGRVISSFVMDASSGAVLHAENADKITYPASLTKVMTLMMVFDALDKKRITLETRFKVSKHAARQKPTKMGYKAGDTIRVIDLINAIAVKSANDAAVVAAEGISGSEAKFAIAMTKKARQFGMKNTTFRNASGLPDLSQKTTARDMAILARALIYSYGHHYHYFEKTSFTYAGKVVEGHNHVTAKYPGADGIKTGYINASGYNLITSAKRNNRRLIGVVLGGGTVASRDSRMVELLDAGFAKVLNGQSSPLLMADAAGRKMPSVAARPSERSTIVASAPAAKRLPDRSSTATRTASSARTWGIQVGAFSGKKPAETALVDAKKTLGGAIGKSRGTIVSFKSGKNMVYRARLMNISEIEARTACKKLASGKKTCSIVSPA